MSNVTDFPNSRIVSERNAKRGSSNLRWLLDQQFTVAEIAPWLVTAFLAGACFVMVRI